MTTFYYVVGPTLFHLFFPIPKCNKEIIIENTPLFKRVKNPHTFTVHAHLRGINFPGIKETWDQQVKLMDPRNFIEVSYKNYSDKIII
jgi:hypothetical protein